ncbi:hypothetical protein TNCV_1187911 [Trichonephila clavipes]|nr:hypothetical protein TNCV_1187911 [Trichonephila clavipes]
MNKSPSKDSEENHSILRVPVDGIGSPDVFHSVIQFYIWKHHNKCKNVRFAHPASLTRSLYPLSALPRNNLRKAEQICEERKEQDDLACASEDNVCHFEDLIQGGHRITLNKTAEEQYLF